MLPTVIEASPPPSGPGQIVVVRHGATSWSRSGRHTGRTDLPLDEGGEADARSLGARLSGFEPARVLTSPLARARVTCELAGFAASAIVVEDLAEWDYGQYEGLTTPEIRTTNPGWDLFDDGCPGGEDGKAVGRRVDRVLERLGDLGADDTALLFAHGHVLRVLAARYLGLDPSGARLFTLEAGSLSVLGYDREQRVVRLWNS